MEITTKRHRYYAIRNWTRRGVIYSDLDELYNIYINTMNCEHCLKEFTSSRDRCLDHCHETGVFRKIVCQKCNINDGYIKYPNGYTEEIRKQNKNKKNNCECGGLFTNSHKAHHNKSKKHLIYLEKKLDN
jgi:hypothetical protein